MALRVHRAARGFLQGVADVGPRIEPGRRETEEHRRRNRDPHREDEHPDVQLAGETPRRVQQIRRGQREQPSDAPRRDDDAERAAGEREHRALRQQLADDAPAPGAERLAYRHLACARSAARQQQVRDVGARDQQHEDDRAHEHQQRRRRVAGVDVPQRGKVRAPAFQVRVRLLHLLGHGVELRLRRFRRHARLEASDRQVVVPRIGGLQADARNPQLRDGRVR